LLIIVWVVDFSPPPRKLLPPDFSVPPRKLVPPDDDDFPNMLVLVLGPKNA
jgi:hypothetical protein